MMQMTGIIENGKDTMIDITIKGRQIAENARDIPGLVAEEVKQSVIQLNKLIDGIDTETLYKDLKIVL